MFFGAKTHKSEAVESTVTTITNIDSLILLSSLHLEAAWDRGDALRMCTTYHKAAFNGTRHTRSSFNAAVGNIIKALGWDSGA